MSRRLRVVIVTGVYPPQTGGPATHSAALREELQARGHAVHVLTLGKPTVPGVIAYPRHWRWPRRMAAVAWWLIRARQRYDVIYATGIHLPAVLGGRVARRPVMAKVVGDPVWERARRRGLTSQDFTEFQADQGGALRVRFMRAARSWWLRRADSVTVPSEYLAEVVQRWEGSRARPVVIYNRARAHGDGPRTPPAGELRVVFAGRLVEHKRVDVILDAVSQVPPALLDVIGAGPEAERLRTHADGLGLGARASFRGALPHSQVLKAISGSDLLVLASDYEGLPHVAVEALACGTPVAAVDVGGVREVVRDGVNGVIVNPPTADGFAAVFHRLADDPGELERLRAGAASEARSWRFERSVDEIEIVLRRLAMRKPLAVFVGNTQVEVPSTPGMRRKLDALSQALSPVVVASGPLGVRRIGDACLVSAPFGRLRGLGTAAYMLVGPALAVTVASFRPGSAVVCKSPYEGFMCVLARIAIRRSRRPSLVIEVHGDWRASSRLYGGPVRRLVAPLADQIARVGLRKADRVRVVSDWLEERVRSTGFGGEIDKFPAFSDVRSFLEKPAAPLPSRPRVAYVGVLDRPKGIDVLLTAWRAVVTSLPDAELEIVGDGPLGQQLRRQATEAGLGEGVAWRGKLAGDQVMEVLDRSSCLVLPSRSEGLGRVLLEAAARGRPAVGSAVGGIPQVIDHGSTGLLVPSGDADALADALVELLSKPDRLQAMSIEARERVLASDPATAFDAGWVRLAGWLRDD